MDEIWNRRIEETWTRGSYDTITIVINHQDKFRSYVRLIQYGYCYLLRVGSKYA